MTKAKHAHYWLDHLGVFNTSHGESDFCRLPCSLHTAVGKFDCENQAQIEKAIRAHCSAAGIFDAESIIQWALETEADVITPQMVQSGAPHTGVCDGWMVF